MDWDLQDFGWESSCDPLDSDPKQDHHHHHHHHHLGFTSSSSTPPQKITTDDEDEDVAAGSSSSGGRPVGPHKAVACLVDGCAADLSGCREYHKRHRVCERHSKTPIVVVKGEEKRFCQQCSRFHSLGEFDEVKRSCRKRLDGHNRRRRKSHPHPLFFTSNNFMSAYKGPRILQFGDPVWNLETKAESWLYSNPSDEEIPLPIDSGGRALYLLSTTQTPHQPNINNISINENRSFQLLDYDPFISNKTVNGDRVYGP